MSMATLWNVSCLGSARYETRLGIGQAVSNKTRRIGNRPKSKFNSACIPATRTFRQELNRKMV